MILFLKEALLRNGTSGVRAGGVSPAENVRVARVQVNLVALHVVVELLCSQDFGNPHQLVVVIVTVEEWLLAKYLNTERLVYKQTSKSTSTHVSHSLLCMCQQ